MFPIGGAVILFVLIVLAIWILRSDADTLPFDGGRQASKQQQQRKRSHQIAPLTSGPESASPAGGAYTINHGGHGSERVAWRWSALRSSCCWW